MVQYKCHSDTICAMYLMFITRTGKGKEFILTLRNLLNPRIRKAWALWGFIPQQPNSSGCEPAHIPVLPFRLSLVLSSKSTRRTAYQNCFKAYFCKFPLTFKKKKEKNLRVVSQWDPGCLIVCLAFQNTRKVSLTKYYITQTSMTFMERVAPPVRPRCSCLHLLEHHFDACKATSSIPTCLPTALVQYCL